MCGFLGVVQRSPVTRQAFQQALASISYRGPDHTGMLFDDFETGAGSVYAGLGHCRLSILDLDPRSHQPFTDGERHLLFNGEIYNFRDVRAARFVATEFRTEGDTELVHRALSTVGAGVCDEFNGMWAACLLDKPRRMLTCCRDRYGVKPLFFYHDAERFVVASEVKAILRYLGGRPAIRPDKIDEFLAEGICYADPRGETFFSGVHQVRAGHAIEFDAVAWRVTERAWHDFRAACAEPCESLRERVESAVLSRLISDRPVGLLLSGGIDSSLILAVLVANGRQDQVQCFIGQTGATVSEDAAYARRCAERAGIEAVEIASTFAADAFHRFMSMCWHHEKPFPMGGNAVAMYEMYSHISAYDVPVVIDGTGGDEVFGGYWDRYLSFAVRDAVAAGDIDWLHGLLTAAGKDAELRRLTARSFRELPAAGGLARRGGPVDIYGRECVRNATRTDPLVRFPGSLAEAMLVDASAGRLAEWLWHNDRNSMAFGIENRSPFLDRSLMPMIGQGYAAKFQGAWNKISLRSLFSEFVEMPTQWRLQKQGFRWPRELFLRANRARVVDLIGQSPLVRERVDVDRFLAEAARDERLYVGEFTGRLVSVAGFGEAFANP